MSINFLPKNRPKGVIPFSSMSSLIIGILLIYLGFFLVLALRQRTFLYHPEPWPEPEALQRWLDQEQLTFWPNEETPWGFTQAQDFQGTATALVFHGNAGTALDRLAFLRALEPFGWRVILMEYPVYGTLEGSLGEQAFVSRAVEAVQLAEETFGRPVYLIGESLGSGVAAATAPKVANRIDGLVLVTPWDSLGSVAQEKFPWFPVRWVLLDRYHSVNHLKSLKLPMVVVLAEQDETIPPRHADRLFAALSGPKRIIRFPEAGHSTYPLDPEDSWWAYTVQFLTSQNQHTP
jgi:hypothetical protein